MNTTTHPTTHPAMWYPTPVDFVPGDLVSFPYLDGTRVGFLIAPTTTRCWGGVKPAWTVKLGPDQLCPPVVAADIMTGLATDRPQP